MGMATDSAPTVAPGAHCALDFADKVVGVKLRCGIVQASTYRISCQTLLSPGFKECSIELWANTTENR